MNIQEKNKAIQLIFRALAIQFIPLIIWGRLSNAEIISEDSPLFGIVALFIFGVLLYGYFPFIKGCRRYIQSKEYSPNWGWLGLLSIVGLFILCVIPPKNSIILSENSSEKQLTNTPFDKINLVEIFIFYLFGTASAVVIFIFLYVIVNNGETRELFRRNMDKPIEYFTIFFLYCIWLFLVLRDLKIAGFKIKDFIPNLKNLSTLVIKIAIIYSVFNLSFARLINYYSSFIFPNYIENFINDYKPVNISLFLVEILFSIPIIFFIILIIAIVLQKWSLKWSNKRSIFLLSFIGVFLQALSSFHPSAVLTFFDVIIICILFFKTANLLNAIVYAVIYHIILDIFYFVSYNQNLKISYISIIEYREKHEAFLILYLILGVISLGLIIDFIRKNFPKQNDMIPYFQNRK